MAAATIGEFVGVVVEVSPYLTLSSSSAAFGHVVESLLVWCQAHAMCQRGGGLLVVAAQQGKTAVVHSSAECPNFADGAGRLSKALHDAASETPEERTATVATAAAIGRVLCAARRKPLGTPCRVLVLKLGLDLPAEYNATMNCVFAAARHSVVVDALTLGPPGPSVLMQQAARMTGGLFLHLHLQQSDQLLTHLISLFAASLKARAHLNLPPLLEADFKAACFCCTPPKSLESGWVCSSCLAIYCNDARPCSCSKLDDAEDAAMADIAENAAAADDDE